MVREPTGPVVAGIDGSSITPAVVALAAQVATAHATPLVLVHAAQAGTAVPLAAAVADARRHVPGCAVSGELVAGDPVAALLARTAQASAIVLGRGTPGRRRSGRSRCGAVTLGVLGRATAPVFVCRRDGPAPPDGSPRPVVVGIDGTAGSEDAVEFGFAQAARRGAPLLVLRVSSTGESAPAGGGGRRHPDGAVDDLVERWSTKYPDVPARTAAREGLDSAIVLAAASRSALLLVVASNHPVGERPVPPGSALAALLERAACPVAVVPATTTGTRDEAGGSVHGSRPFGPFAPTLTR